MLIKKLTLIAFLFLSTAGIGLAATYYVDSNSGNDANSGTSVTSAWNFISKVNAASFNPGDNILFLRGCTWTGTLNFNNSGSSSAPIVYGSYGSGTLPIIDAKNANACAIIQSKNYITIQYIKFQNAADAPGGTVRVTSGVGIIVKNCEVYLTTQGSVFIQNSSNCTIAHNTVTTPTFLNVQTDGIYSQRNSHNTYECNRIIISNTEPTNHDDCIQSFQDTSLTIRDNYLEQLNSKLQNAQGIYITTGAGTFTIYNNVVKCPNNQANIIGFDNLTTGTGKLVLYNNTVIGGGANTLRIPSPATVTIMNNVFVTTYGSTLIQFSSIGSGSVIDYNLYYRQDGAAAIVGYSGSKTLAQWKAMGYDVHGLNTNPMLNDSLYPATNSPIINAGTNLGGIFNVDKNGNPRPQTGAPDLGAYETGSTTGIGGHYTTTSVLKDFDLPQNFPNPFNPSTVIKYVIGNNTHVIINVYDITGRMVRELVNEDKPAGQYSVEFKSENLASGTYIYMIKAGNFTKSNKMILLK